MNQCDEKQVLEAGRTALFKGINNIVPMISELVSQAKRKNGSARSLFMALKFGDLIAESVIDKSNDIKAMKNAGIEFSDFLLWLAITGRKDIKDPSAVISEFIEGKAGGELDILLKTAKVDLGIILKEENVSPIPHDPYCDTNYEITGRFFSDNRGNDDTPIYLVCKETYNGKERAVVRGEIYGTKKLKIYDKNVLATLIEGALKNRYEDGGWGISWRQLARAYFGMDSHDRVAQSVIDMMKESVARLRSSGLNWFDFSDLGEKERTYLGSVLKTEEPEPFLLAQTGLIRVASNKKYEYDEGIVLLKIPTMFAVSNSMNRIRRISKELRPKGMARNEETEERFVMMLDALVKSQGKANITVYMFDQLTKEERPRIEIEGLLREESHKPPEQRKLTRQKIRSTSAWLESLLKYWKEMGVCNYAIEYKKTRGKNTEIIHKVRLFGAKKEKIFVSKKLSIGN